MDKKRYYKSEKDLQFNNLALGEIFIFLHDKNCEMIPLCKKIGVNTYISKTSFYDERKRKSRVNISGVAYQGCIVLRKNNGIG